MSLPYLYLLHLLEAILQGVAQHIFLSPSRLIPGIGFVWAHMLRCQLKGYKIEPYLYILSIVLLVAFMVSIFPPYFFGAWILFPLGAALNVIPFVANGLHMPVAEPLFRKAGFSSRNIFRSPSHVRATKEVRCYFLIDRLALPRWYLWGKRNSVRSIGDVVVDLAVYITIVQSVWFVLRSTF